MYLKLFDRFSSDSIQKQSIQITFDNMDTIGKIEWPEQKCFPQ